MKTSAAAFGSGEKIESLRRQMFALFKGVPYNTHHIDHALRVERTCASIGIELDADLATLRAAAILHDIARINEVGDGRCHAARSAEIASGILKEDGWAPLHIRSVAYAIRCHRYRSGIVPETLEAKILQDADRLDALGAIGIARVISHDPTRRLYDHWNCGDPFSGNCVTAHFFEKILKLRDTMHTSAARKIAAKRHRYLVGYLQELKREIFE